MCLLIQAQVLAWKDVMKDDLLHFPTGHLCLEELFEEALQTENTFLDGKLMVFCGETSKAESRK